MLLDNLHATSNYETDNREKEINGNGYWDASFSFFPQKHSYQVATDVQHHARTCRIENNGPHIQSAASVFMCERLLQAMMLKLVTSDDAETYVPYVFQIINEIDNQT